MAETTSLNSAALPKAKKESQIGAVVKRLRKNKAAMAGLIILLLLILLSVAAPLIAPYAYEEMDLLNMNQDPSGAHWFGTDSLGRDIFTRILYGGRYSLSLGLLATILGAIVGVALGSVAGYFGGLTDNIILRLMDVLQAIPGILLAILVSAVLGPGFGNTIIAMAVGSIPMNVRLMRASILGIRGQEYLEAAASINCSTPRIILKYVLPNSFSPILVSCTMGIGNTILSAAALSFIGLGIQPPLPEWGAMLSAGRSYIRDCPHLVIFPGLLIMVTVLSLNMFGDGLRDAMDPKLKS